MFSDIFNIYFNGLVQERHNSIANTLELCLSFTNPSIFSYFVYSNKKPIMDFQELSFIIFRSHFLQIRLCILF